jgi:lysozyme family protein
MNFDDSFTRLLGVERGYSNNPADPGGETMWGVTVAVARAHGYEGAMKDMPQDFAKSIYAASYWAPIKADQLPDAIRFDIFDAAVNSGTNQAVRWMQQALNVGADGVVGPATLSAAAANPDIAAKFNGFRLDAMTNMASWTSFGKGWARRIAKNLKG